MIAKIVGLFHRQKTDYVLLRMHDGAHEKKPVEWICGRPFAAPFLPSTRCELLPFGKLIGQSYVDGWLPASDNMLHFFKGA